MDLKCELPYKSINIDEQGEVHPCCAMYCSNYSFGNILKESFHKIWNGEKAQEFRKQFVDNDYKYCKLDICLPHRSNDMSIKAEKMANTRPASVLLGYDRTCNVNCIFCRPNNNQRYLKPFEVLEDQVSDLFKDVQYVNIASGGEAFASKHSRNLIKKIAKTYPKIKFDILTNGLLLNEKTLVDLGIIDKINLLGISFHSFDRKAYNKIVKNSDFDEVMKNVKFAVDLKKKNMINMLEFRSVITVYNYKEMVDFANRAKKSSAGVVFLNLIQYDIPNIVFKEIDVINPQHREYNKFVRKLKHPIFKENFVRINPSLLTLEPNGFFKRWFDF